MKKSIESAFSEFYRKSPVILVDIGAKGGLEPNWQPLKKYLYIIEFEPNSREFSLLNQTKDKNIKLLQTGLYNKRKTSVDLYLIKHPGGSSIFKPNRELVDKFPESERFDIIGVERIETDTLDNQFQIHSINDADFIKIDTEGSELFILQGATKVLEKYIFGLEVEAEFLEFRKNQPLFSDVDSFVRKQGFQLFDIERWYYKRKIGIGYGKSKGQLAWCNALYLRKSEYFIEMINRIENDFLKKSKILKAISICLLYGYIDYALEILDVLSSLFTPDELLLIKKIIRSNTSYSIKIPYFKGKGRIANLFRTLWEFFNAPGRGWVIRDKRLGA